MASRIKYVLKSGIKHQILSSQEIIAKIADRTFRGNNKPIQFNTIKNRIENDLPIVTTYQSAQIIKEVLGLPEHFDIFESVQVEIEA